ncbi:MAG: VOC family protein [Quadrisphaera sp.]
MSDTTQTPQTTQPLAQPRGIHHVRLSVTDIERSKAFYTALVGAEPAVDKTAELSSDPGAVEDPQRFFGGAVFELGEQVLGLRPVPAASGQTFSPDRPGLDHISLAVDSRTDLDAASARLAAAGVEHGEVIEIPAQGIAVLSLQDPDDINLELTAPLG